MTGFQFRELHVEGPNKHPATLTFARGLNVISGPSDTGKSYVVALLDFMLGSGKELRDVVEAHGYERAALTIESHDGRIFTLFRLLRGGDIECVEGSRSSKATRTVLPARHSTKDASLSGFLLDICGLKGKRLKRNSQNQTQELSFRNLAPLIIVSETEMIRAGSPVLTGNYVSRTPEASVFKLLLTGEDDSALIAGEKPDLVKARLKAQIELLDGLIRRYAKDVGDTESNALALERALSDLTAKIAESYARINDGRSSLETYQVQRAEAWDSRERAAARLAEIDGLLERFVLLAEHYQTDKQRLDALYQAGQYFELLPTGNCPLCGAPASEHDSAPGYDDLSTLRRACEFEIAKIETLAAELETTAGALKAERTSLNETLAERTAVYRETDRVVRQRLSPALVEAQRRHSDLLDRRDDVRQRLEGARRLTELRLQHVMLLSALDSIQKPREAKSILPASALAAFTENVVQLLTAWSFPFDGDVTFDSERLDLVIGPRPRSAQGKGLRALTHAAFNLALLSTCRQEGLPHPGFVVLDSPLVTFRQADVLEGGEDDGLTAQERVEVKRAFYADLARRNPDDQFVIIENDDPDKGLLAEIVWHPFTKNSATGRHGFFPVQ